MRILILAHNLRAAGGLSVGRNIVSALSRVGTRHSYLFVLPAGVGYEEIEKPPRSSSLYFRRKLGAAGQLLLEMGGLPRLLRSYRPDMVWGLGNFGLVKPGGARQAVLFHKTQFVYERRHQVGEVWRRRLLNSIARWRLQNALPATQLVFCQTHTVAQRFTRSFRYKGRIALLPNAVSTVIGNAVDRPAVFDRLTGKFVMLCVTRYYPHKNLEILVDLFRRHSLRLRDVAVIVTVHPDQHPRAPRFLASLKEPLVRDHVINIGPVDQSLLAAYYTHSDALIMPTLLESFSGSYLEAMQLRRPILTSDLDFAHDVCGAAAAYFNPTDTHSICKTILRVKGSSELRMVLATQGSERLGRLSRDWDSIVRDALREIEQLSDLSPAEPAEPTTRLPVGDHSICGYLAEP